MSKGLELQNPQDTSDQLIPTHYHSNVPYLPQEIIARIFYVARPNLASLLSLALVSHTWSIEAQRKLFQSIKIRSDCQLRSLLLALEGDRLGIFVQRLRISFHSSDDTQQLVHQILPYLFNLQSLDISTSSTPAGLSHVKSGSVSTIHSLPTLTTFTYTNDGLEGDYFESILRVSPNLEDLTINLFDVKDFDLRSIMPAHLKRLNLTEGMVQILVGTLWPSEAWEGLEGLEELTLATSEDMNIPSLQPFHELIGSKLKKLSIEFHQTFPLSSYTVLEELSCTSIDLELLQQAPTSIITLRIDSNDEGEMDDTLRLPEVGRLSNLKHFYLGDSSRKLDLTLLPPLISFTIGMITLNKLLGSLRVLEIGQVRFSKLLLGCDLDKNDLVIEECKRLQIELEEWDWRGPGFDYQSHENSAT